MKKSKRLASEAYRYQRPALMPPPFPHHETPLLTPAHRLFPKNIVKKRLAGVGEYQVAAGVVVGDVAVDEGDLGGFGQLVADAVLVDDVAGSAIGRKYASAHAAGLKNTDKAALNAVMVCETKPRGL
ncbi:hypothetical protein [Vreelandella jeotgali]|uniref:hypothetical protein n=1 Tax=Vreelandella jeotgali TaxID=553386 RepID=UPI0012E9CB73|nr:hypothetical protein [Halomonas jeotgali]